MSKAYQIHKQEQTYYLTFQVVGWVDVFSRQVYRDIIIDSFDYCIKHKGLRLHAYVIMTNHVHAIVTAKNSNLSDVIRDFKKFTSKKILSTIEGNNKESRREWMMMIFRYYAKYSTRNSKHQFWTHENHAVEMDNLKTINTRLNYIHENPVRAGWVERAEDYLYSSARNYSELESKIDVELI